MSGVRNWAAGSALTALILLSPVVAFLMVITAEMLIDVLMEARATAVGIVAAGAIGGVIFRKMSPHREVAAQLGSQEEPDETAIAAPPM